MAAEQLDQIKTKFEGSWLLDRSENFDEFLQAIGLNEAERKKGDTVKATCEISVDGENITIASGTGLGNRSETFTLGQEYDAVSRGGPAKVISTLEDGKLITKATYVDAQKAIPTMIRDILDEQMYFELHMGDVVCKRYYNRVARM